MGRCKERLHKRSLAGQVFSGNIKSRAVVRRSSDKGESSGKINPSSLGEMFERNQSLIVVHGQHRVKFGISISCKKAIRSVGTKTKNPLRVGLFYRRGNNRFVLISDQTIVPRMRIETQHCNFWLLN